MELTAVAPRRTPLLRTTLRIAGLGTYVPEHRITNEELSVMVDTDDEWIRRRTGIRERRKARADEFTSDMCLSAVGALVAGGASLAAVDYIIAATITPDYQFPSVSAIVQHRLGLRNTGAIDISAACAGFVYALDLADALISTGRARNVLVVAGETLTKITDYRDRSMCILFGDGAGAALVTPDDGNGSAILARRVNSDGAAGKHLFMTALKKEIAGIVEPEHLMRQNGRAVYEWVVTNVTAGINELLAAAQLAPDEIDWFIPHSANMRMIEAVRERCGIPVERTLTSMQWFGNTSTASIPLALAPAVADGRIKRGDRVLLYGFGGGLVEAGLLLRW
ncbi:MAG: beta-ketoacyl-ACP synthase 3 [Candidatus Velthaea sp.]|jgi:3-oxoacyl-[acyl-carrier-protein] synthase-3